jgi:hypothetical protein
MARELTSHRLDKNDHSVVLESWDEPDRVTKLYSKYRLSINAHGVNSEISLIKFQKGDKELEGVNGVDEAVLIALLMDRFACRQAASPNREQAIVLTKLEEALLWLQHSQRNQS